MRLLTRVPLVAAALLAMLATGQRAAAADSGQPRTPRTRRVLYNLDGDSCMFTKKNAKTPVTVTPDDLKTVVDEITYPGSQVDTLLVCINAQCMYYPTKVGDRRGTLATLAQRAKWPPSEEQRFRNVEAMFAAGVDPYALLLSEARRHGLEALLTYRMNDIHGDAFLEHKFWVQHPEYRLPKPYDSFAVRHAGLDFRHDAVCDYTFRLIEEAVGRYDSDGIELDFVRCPAFFAQGTEGERIATMNKLVRRVRQMLDAEGKRRGRRLVLAVRVLPDYGECRSSGLDPVVWEKEGWIDFLTVSPYSGTQYDLPIKAWKERMGNVPIYGCADSAGTAANNRLAAQQFRKAGADGTYLFNFFCPREWFVEPPFEVLKDLGDPRKFQVHKILFLGNSITCCGPKYWGLAASTADKDYAHLLAGAIGAKTGGSLTMIRTTAPTMSSDGRIDLGESNVVNIADVFERGYVGYNAAKLCKQLAWKADLVVLQFGENIPLATFRAEVFKDRLKKLVADLKQSSNPQIVMPGYILGSNATVDEMKRNVCAEDPTHRVFVDLSRVGQDASNMGDYGHPNDKGMALIADTLLRAILAHSATASASTAQAGFSNVPTCFVSLTGD